jgi:putative tryptophan/tyrosine transport system substrate-binding protein
MKRREFITLLGGTAVTWPHAALAQQAERIRRVGVLMSTTAGNADREAHITVFRDALGRFGWAVGKNIRIDYRSAAGDADRLGAMASELIALSPDVLVTPGSPATAAMMAATRTLPIVFVEASDPLGSGLVKSLAHPGGNITGFTFSEFSLGSKWLEALKEIAPHVEHVLVLAIPENVGSAGLLQAVEGGAPRLGVQLLIAPIRTASEIEGAFNRITHGGSTGVVVLPGAPVADNQALIVALAERHHAPVIYPNRSFIGLGGLMFYGYDVAEQYRQAASYVDRILKGERTADLPVQAPTKYELVINLKTAKALGLEIPPTLLARADEVIE